MEKFKSNISGLGSAVETKVFHVENKILRRGDHGYDEELLEHYRHDIVKSISALKYFLKSTNRIGSKHWPHLIKSIVNMTQAFRYLIAEGSLTFKGIEDYYTEFDKWQAEEETPRIHPKERQLIIPSICQELSNYEMTFREVGVKILFEWEMHTESMKVRVNDMIGYLKKILKLLKKRNNRKDRNDLLNKKANKYLKKTVPLEPKEQAKLASIQGQLKESSRSYEKIDKKVRAILPHALTFLEEFIETLTKITMCKQLQTYKEIYDACMYFSSFHGYLDEASETLIQPYSRIIESWETEATASRLKIESFVSFIREKNPDLLNKEIDDKNNQSTSEKFLTKINFQVNKKTHTVKAKDPKNGIFAEYLMKDPLQSFLEYNDPSMSVSETYYPTALVETPIVYSNSSTAVDVKAGKPPLPPRSNTARPGSKLTSVPYESPYYEVLFSSESIDEDDDKGLTESESESDLSDFSDDSESTTTSAATSTTESTYDSNLKDRNEVLLKKLFNSEKNNIKESPIHCDLDAEIGIPQSFTHIQEPSISYKLEKLNDFFDKILKDTQRNSSVSKLTALHGFSGEEPGDLSFEKGEKIDVLIKLQDFRISHRENSANWILGRIRDTKGSRIGFVPSNYLEE